MYFPVVSTNSPLAQCDKTHFVEPWGNELSGPGARPFQWCPSQPTALAHQRPFAVWYTDVCGSVEKKNEDAAYIDSEVEYAVRPSTDIGGSTTDREIPLRASAPTTPNTQMSRLWFVRMMQLSRGMPRAPHRLTRPTMNPSFLFRQSFLSVDAPM